MSDEIPEAAWKMIQAHLGYNDEELELFKKHPRNRKVMAAAPDLGAKTIVFTVVESTGCNSHHTVGSRFFFTGDGNLLTKMAPPKVCAFILPVMTQAIFGMQELWYAGADPKRLTFNRGGCFDVGVKCGGWGHVVVEADVMPREEAQKLFESAK